MDKNKFYAVKIGKNPGIYGTWTQCQEQISGFPGAIYKAFRSLEDAEAFINGVPLADTNNDVKDINEEIEKRISELSADEVVAFVDGSYQDTDKKSAFGAILFDNSGNKEKLYKAFTENLGKEFIELRNTAAELEGVKEAINWSIKYGKKKIYIYYDYQGIEAWAKGTWKAKNNITKDYVSFIKEVKSIIEIEFMKVTSHTGIKYNEEVDQLAKDALLAKGYKTYSDGSVYFTGQGVSDWEAIIKSINDEISELDNEIATDLVTYTIEKGQDPQKTKTKIKIKQQKDIVTINCYRDTCSYVQGKQSVLFQKIIARAVELSRDKQKVVEVLNAYHALHIEVDEIENDFSKLLPDYHHKSDKLRATLLSAVYNTKITGYMPDYTFLVTPIFRAYEYYLHRILGDFMNHKTKNDNGANNFAYFEKNGNKYQYSGKNNNKLSITQLEYLNEFYNNYNKIRHPYSHWSASDTDVAIITEVDEARHLLLDGLDLINKYYTLFNEGI